MVNQVQLISGLVRWPIDELGLHDYQESLPFQVGEWTWQIAVSMNRPQICIKLHWEDDDPFILMPTVSFTVRVISPTGLLLETLQEDVPATAINDMEWKFDIPPTGRHLIEVEFFNIHTEEKVSMWNERCLKLLSTSMVRMLNEGVLADIVIETSSGLVNAHRAVLASRSPVFNTMFSTDMKEKQTSMLKLHDMTEEVCRLLLNYLYGNLEHGAFLSNRLLLLELAERYDIRDLKQACNESLLEDINCDNVIDRLHASHIFNVPDLKKSCLAYLIQFGKISEVKDALKEFVQRADKDLVGELCEKLADAFKVL